MALMLVDGRVDVASFETVPRDEVVAVARRMEWQPMEAHGFPERFAARIEVETPRGQVVAEISQVRGAPDRPVTQSDIQAKFAANAGRRFSPSRTSDLAAAILGIGDASDAGQLADLLSA